MKSTPVPTLTRRDCGELENNRPKLPRGELAHILKTYWYEGKRQGEMAKLTGKGVDYIKKFTACFSRALNASPIGGESGREPGKEVQYTEKKQPKKPQPKNRKSLTVNFPKPLCRSAFNKSEKILKFDMDSLPKNSKSIPLTKGCFAIVDESDYDWLSGFSWRADFQGKTHYAITKRKVNGHYVLMHRLILGLTDRNIHCDHINGRGYDNRRSNVRTCTVAENKRNQGPSIRNTSGFKGVSIKAKSQRWVAQIKVNGVTKHLGYFKSIIEAAKAYNEAAKKHHGEFANLNEV